MTGLGQGFQHGPRLSAFIGDGVEQIGPEIFPGHGLLDGGGRQEAGHFVDKVPAGFGAAGQ